MIKLPKYYTQKLDNGLELVAIPTNNNSSVISTDVFYKVGSKHESMGKSGMAHMLEHLNFKSTKNYKAGEFDEIVKAFGGVNNASTGFDYTHYFIQSSSENLAKSLKLFAEIMENLKLKKKEFLPERDVVYEERLWRTDNSPIGYLYFRLFNHAFLYHPYHWTPIGFKDDIKNWSIKDIKKFHKTYYQPQNAVVIVSGDFEVDKFFSLAKKYFSHIKNHGKIPKKHEIEPEQNGAKRIILHRKTDVQMYALAYKVPNFEHEDNVALNFLSEILSSGKSSRLVKRIIEQKQLASQIYGYNIETKDPGIFLFLAECNANIKAKEVEKELLKIIEEIKNGTISDEEINKIRLIFKSDFIYSLQTASGLSSVFGSFFAKDNIKALHAYIEKIESINAEELQKVAQKYFIEKNSTTIILKGDKHAN